MELDHYEHMTEERMAKVATRLTAQSAFDARVKDAKERLRRCEYRSAIRADHGFVVLQEALKEIFSSRETKKL